MKRSQLEHLLRAASAITDEREFAVLGSQSILGAYPTAPEDVTLSVEADLVALNHPEKWNEIDGVLGELSSFHENYGHYAQDVELSTAVLPAHWRHRAIAISNENTRGAVGYCLEPHDLALAKYVANRPKDRDFIRACFRHGLIHPDVLLARVAELPVAEERQRTIVRLVAIDSASTHQAPRESDSNPSD